MLRILLAENVTSSVLEFLIDFTIEPYRQNKNLLDIVILDFSRIKYIDIEVALLIICFCAALKRKNRQIDFRLKYPSEGVLSFLMTLGFFSQMSNKIEVMDVQHVLHAEDQLQKDRRSRLKQKSNSNDSPPVILPIETIAQKINTISGNDFENMVGSFVNHAIDSFELLRTSTQFNFSGEDYYQFRQSNIELYKNIFHHSQSWGIASIHARPNYGTTVCYYDIGIGFKKSIKKFNTELESIEWALIDGNTSKPDGDNDGYGLTLVQEFVFRRNGKIKIRSGDCLIQLNSNLSRRINKVKSFPGVQISYFIPV
jgi:hypothetical protein